MNAYTAVENELFLHQCIYACLFDPIFLVWLHISTHNFVPNLCLHNLDVALTNDIRGY